MQTERKLTDSFLVISLVVFSYLAAVISLVVFDNQALSLTFVIAGSYTSITAVLEDKKNAKKVASNKEENNTNV